MQFLTRLRAALPSFPVFCQRIPAAMLRGAWRLLLGFFMLLLLLALAWQFLLVPRVNEYRGWVAGKIGAQTGMVVQIDALSAGWDGARPELTFSGVHIRGRKGEQLLDLQSLSGSLSWWKLLLGDVRFSIIELDRPVLTLLRNPQGRWFVGGSGFSGGEQSSDGNTLLHWLLDQGGLRIHSGTLLVVDQQRSQGRTLRLEQVDFDTSQLFGFRSVALGMNLPAGMGGRMTLGGKLHGRDPDQLADWSGSLDLHIPDTDLARLGDWISLFRSQERLRGGHGELNLAISFDGEQLEQLDGRLLMRDLQLRLGEESLVLPSVDAGLSWQATRSGEEFRLDGRRIVTPSGDVCQPCRLDFSRKGEQSSLSGEGVQLSGLNALLPFLPADWRARTEGLTLNGQLARFSLDWQGKLIDVRRYDGEVQFAGLALAWPGVLPQLGGATGGGLDGELSFTQDKGEFLLRGDKVTLDYPAQFIEPLHFSEVKLETRWQRQSQGWKVQFPEVRLASADMQLAVQGQYEWPGKGLGRVMLDGDIVRMDANRVYAYLPREIGDDTLAWLKHSLRAGRAEAGKIRWHGEVADFPYPDAGKGAPAGGVFDITARARTVTLAFADDWPAIEQINGQLHFSGLNMKIDAPEARVFGVRLLDVRTEIPDLGQNQHVLIEGRARGPINDYLRFLAGSPLVKQAAGIPASLKADGNGELALKLDIPLDDVDATQLSGRYSFRADRLDFGEDVPLLQQAHGQLLFDQDRFRIEEASAQALGGPVHLTAGSDGKGGMNFTLKGEAQSEQLLKHYALPLPMSGPLAYQGNLNFRPGQFDLQLQSALKGIAVELPRPMRKAAGTELPLRIRLSGSEKGRQLALSYGQLLQLDWLKNKGMPVQTMISLGSVAIPSSKPGLVIQGGWPELAVQEWYGWLQTQSAQQGKGELPVPALSAADVTFGSVAGWGRQLQDVRLNYADLGTGWMLKMNSRQLAGQLISGGQGRPLQARLDRLQLPWPELTGVSAGNADMAASPLTRHWSAFDVEIRQLAYKSAQLGALSINAKAIPNGWQVDSLSIVNPDGTLRLSGQWLLADAQPRGNVRFTLESSDTGKLLGRLGYPQSLYRAPGSFNGELGWTGSDAVPDFTTLQGKLHLDLGSGRFARVEAGNAARLLSVLSLQSLARRVRLDFNDVVAEGMEFDRIRGDAQIDRGMLRTGNLLIDSPAADIKFSGEANLVAASQNMRVRIVPKIGDTVALAATAVNPIAGIATLALGKAFNDPFGQMIAMEYAITGSMADPQINRIDRLDTLRGMMPGASATSVAPGRN